MTKKEFETKQAELLSSIPKEFHKAMNHIAWEQGHAYGYNEVLLILNDMVYAFKEPCKEFENRIRKENQSG